MIEVLPVKKIIWEPWFVSLELVIITLRPYFMSHRMDLLHIRHHYLESVNWSVCHESFIIEVLSVFFKAHFLIGKDITVVSSDADHDVGSAKLHIKNIVNYTWEHKYHPGQVVAHDKSGKYVAYSITTSNKGCGIVRIINRESTDRYENWYTQSGITQVLGLFSIRDGNNFFWCWCWWLYSLMFAKIT